MSFKQIFTFDEDILPLIEDKLRRSYGKKGHKDVHTGLEIKQDPNAHIVGQVTDDVLLFTWDGKKEKCDKEITFFALYNITTKEPTVLFDYDRKIDVVTASVNEEQTLLAFTVTEFKPSLDNLKEGTVGIYKSFIAEISPKNRVFSLGIERPHYQRVEFLHGKYPLYGSSSRRESHMLFFHHSESIDLYHIPLARIDGGMVMSGQPQIEHLVKGFLWAQIDHVNKRLYYMCSVKEATEEAQVNSQTTNEKLTFWALQFFEKSPHVTTVKMPCPFAISPNTSDTGNQSQYDRRAFKTVIADSSVNMEVITSPEGSLFLCYQHSPTSKRRASQETTLSNEEIDGSIEGEIEETVIEYSILMTHHGSILKCKISTVVPEHLVDSAKLTFTMLNDCIAVILPRYVFHLLDCNAEHPPCHHLILQGIECVQSSSLKQPSEFVAINTATVARANKQELCFFEPSSGSIYKLKFDNTYWTDCFLSTHRDTTRLALLHFSIIHLQDPEISSQIFSHLVGDPANLECLDILKEYLIGSTNFQMKFQVEPFAYKLLPFSNTEPFRGHLEKDRAGNKIARIMYSSCNTQDIFAQNFKGQDEKKRELDFWILLKRNISLTSSVKRFSLKKVAMTLNEQSVDSSSTASGTGLTSLFRRFRKFPYVEPNGSGNGDLPSEYIPEFLEFIKCDPDTKSKEERNNMKVLESLTRYLHHYLPSEIPKLKIQKMATEYTRCQKKQSSYLLQMFWSGLKYTDNTHPYHESLEKRGTSRDRALLMLLERYHVAVKELCFPFPPGFQTFFTFIGFRCLDPKLFSQYVTNGIFEMDNEFMYRLLQDVGDNEAYSQIICRLISLFDQTRAIHFMHKWNNPSVSRLLCQRYVCNLLSQDTVPFENDARNFLVQSKRFDDYEKTISSLLSSTDETSEFQLVPFRPLVNVLTSLETTVQPAKKKRDPKGIGRNEETKSNSALEFVAKHAMRHTANEVDDSLGSVAF